MMTRRYGSDAERKAAMKEYQAKYRALRKSGKWTRKTNVHSRRIAEKLGVEAVPEKVMAHRGEAPILVPVAGKPVAAPAPVAQPPAPAPVAKKPAHVRTVEERLAEEKEKQRRYWHDHYSAVVRARRDAQKTPEQRARCEEIRRRREERKPAGIIRHVIVRLADEQGVTPDEMTMRFIELDAIRFLENALAAHPLAAQHGLNRLRHTAIEAMRFMLDRDHAVLHWAENRTGPKPSAKMV